MPRLSTSSWSLHRALGRPPLFGSGNPVSAPAGPVVEAEVSLLDLPARLAQIGIHTLEIVHFHFPTQDNRFFEEVAAAAKEAGVELFSILIDAGDITHPDATRREQDLAWIRSWIDGAAFCGASHVRVVAGYSHVDRNGGALADHPVIQLSAQNLRALAAYARDQGVRVITENFRETGSRADQLLAILDLCEGEVGLCADFGNFKGETKYEELGAIFPHADSAHVKAEYNAVGQIVEEEFGRGLSLLMKSGFDGPMSLIFDTALHRGESEWDNLVVMRKFVDSYLQPEGR
jgi:sugar phosphate isomerase/epimerase